MTTFDSGVVEELAEDIWRQVTSAARELESGFNTNTDTLPEQHNGIKFAITVTVYTPTVSSRLLVAEVSVQSNGEQVLTQAIVDTCQIRMEGDGWGSFELRAGKVMRCSRPLKRVTQ